MGNVCSWCFKNADENQTDENIRTNSERSLTSTENDERTPLIGKSDNHNHSSGLTNNYNPTILNGGDSTTIAPLLPPPQIHNETTTVTNTETAETKMAYIVEGMLSKLIDVGTGGGNHPQTISTINRLNTQNDQIRHILTKSLSSNKISPLPDAGLSNLPSLLSGRPISSDICHFVAHTAGELSHLLIDEIKIVHKEDLVVVFE